MKLGPVALTPEWHAARAPIITATDTAKILGYSPWGTALTVWERITGRWAPEQGTTPWMQYGVDTEPIHRERIERDFDATIDPVGRLAIHDDIPWLGCTVDGIGKNKAGEWVWEGKAPVRDLWGWKEGVPKMYRLQALTAMEVVGLDRALVSAWLPGDLQWGWLNRSAAFSEVLLGKLDHFWHYHVQRDIPPKPTGATMDAQALARINGEELGKCVPLSPAGVKASRIIEDLEPKLKTGKEVLDRCKNVIRQEIGEAQYGTIVDEGPWSYKSTKSGNRTLKRLKSLPKGVQNG